MNCFRPRSKIAHAPEASQGRLEEKYAPTKNGLSNGVAAPECVARIGGFHPDVRVRPQLSGRDAETKGVLIRSGKTGR